MDRLNNKPLNSNNKVYNKLPLHQGLLNFTSDNNSVPNIHKEYVEEDLQAKLKKIQDKSRQKLLDIHQNLETKGDQIEKLTANYASMIEIPFAVASMILSGKFEGDTAMYILNSAGEWMSNAKLGDNFKKNFVKLAKILGFEHDKSQNNLAEIFDTHEDKVKATVIKALSLANIGHTAFQGVRGVVTKEATTELKSEKTLGHRSLEALSSLIMTIPAIGMGFMTYPAKLKIAQNKLKIKPEDPRSKTLLFTGREDFVCFNEALFVAIRKALTSAFPKSKNLIQTISSLLLSSQSLMNSNATLNAKEDNDELNKGFFKSDFLNKFLPDKLIPITTKLFKPFGINLPDFNNIESQIKYHQNLTAKA